MKPSIDESRYESESPQRDVESAPRDMPRTKDKVKGNVRLRWNHRPSTNISKYRIDKVATTTLRTLVTEPSPVSLTPEQLRRKI